MELNIFSQLNFVDLILSSIILTIIVSAVVIIWDDYFCPDPKEVSAQEYKKASRHKKFLVTLVALLITLLRAEVFEEYDFPTLQEFATSLLLTWSFAVLFYSYLGGKFIEWLFAKIKSLIKIKIDESKL